MSNRSRRTFGIPSIAAVLLLAIAPTGCNYGFQSGTGFVNVETVAVLPFENETTRLELTDELHQFMLQNLPRALGLRPAGEDVADVLVRGTISQYRLSTPNYRAGAQTGDRPEVLQREVSVTVRVEVIDLTENVILWEDANLRADGQFLESETEEVAKEIALDLLVQRIVDGAQSNW